MERSELIKAFENVYGTGGEIRTFFAPGRVNLIGEHTDYNGGHVFPCALMNGTYAAVRLRSDRKLRFASVNVRNSEIREGSLDELNYSKAAGWTNYPRGVFWAYEQSQRHIPCGAEILYFGDIPPGAGLSSSASMEVLTGLLIRTLYSFPEVDLIEIARLAQQAESEFVGVHCGIMDQFISAMGKKDHAVFLAAESLKYQYVPLHFKDTQIVITNSMVRHSLASSKYNERRAECARALKKLQVVSNIKALCDLGTDYFESYKDVIMDPVLTKRARHVVYENARTIRARNALRLNHVERFGELMFASHASLRDDYEVSCPELDFLVERAGETDGVLGSRMTGGGFGGCTVSLIRNDAVETYKEYAARCYQREYQRTPEFYIVAAGDGAHEIV